MSYTFRLIERTFALLFPALFGLSQQVLSLILLRIKNLKKCLDNEKIPSCIGRITKVHNSKTNLKPTLSTLKIIVYKRKGTNISLKHCVKTVISANFHIRKLGEITVFHRAKVFSRFKIWNSKLFFKLKNVKLNLLRQQPTNCLSVFDHFVGLTLKGIIRKMLGKAYTKAYSEPC